MINFRNDILKFSIKYPFVKEVVIADQAWSEVCESFDKQLKQEFGETEKHIKAKDGGMIFNNIKLKPES